MSGALVQLALAKLGGTQTKLAQKLDVSAAQISKWKNGEHMSEEMEKKLRALAKIGNYSPEFVVAAGSVENATKWQEFMLVCADYAQCGNDTGYDGCDVLDNYDDPSTLAADTFAVLQEMGVVIPAEIPAVDKKAKELVSEDDEDLPIFQLIFSLYHAYGALQGFMAASDVSELIDKTVEAIGGIGSEPFMFLNCELLWLAATKVEPDPSLLKSEVCFNVFRNAQVEKFRATLSELKAAAFTQGLPLKAELLDMVEDDTESLSVSAEGESLFNESTRQLHPDIYMNELLLGMREIRTALPLILAKLKIKIEPEPL